MVSTLLYWDTHVVSYITLFAVLIGIDIFLDSDPRIN